MVIDTQTTLTEPWRRTWRRTRAECPQDADLLLTPLMGVLDGSRRRKPRSIRDFAEGEFIWPRTASQGFAGSHFSCEVQPWHRLWLEALDSGLFNDFTLTAPSQSGKTTVGFVIPTMYFLFETRETIILAAPKTDIVQAKWLSDVRPAVKAGRFRGMLPAVGKGSKGGWAELMTMATGAQVRTMSGKGGETGDKQRSSFTARIVIITETDGLIRSELSKEADPLRQLDARTARFDIQKCVIKECTVSTREGNTWRLRAGSTVSAIARPCPKCHEYVTPEREHFKGWEQAANPIEAGAKARFHCPVCDAPWSPAERIAANKRSILVHEGQSIDRQGRVTGDPPVTRSFWMRASAVDNAFRTEQSLGEECWKAAKAIENGEVEEAEQREMELCQFRFATPYDPPGIDTEALTVEILQGHDLVTPRGSVPAGCVAMTGHVDVHGLKKGLIWMVVAFTDSDGSGVIVDYGRYPYTADLGTYEATIYRGLCELFERFTRGFSVVSGGVRKCEQIWIDSGWGDSTEAVYRFCRFVNGAEKLAVARWRVRPAVGRGAGQAERMKPYREPKKKSGSVVCIGDGYFATRLREKQVDVIAFDADLWKTRAHARLRQPNGTPGAVRLPGEVASFAELARAADERKGGKGRRTERERLIAELTSEQREHREIRGRDGRMEKRTVWTNPGRRENHHLDNLVGCLVAAHLCGIGAAKQNEPAGAAEPASQRRPVVITPGDRPFIASRA